MWGCGRLSFSYLPYPYNVLLNYIIENVSEASTINPIFYRSHIPNPKRLRTVCEHGRFEAECNNPIRAFESVTARIMPHTSHIFVCHISLNSFANPRYRSKEFSHLLFLNCYFACLILFNAVLFHIFATQFYFNFIRIGLTFTSIGSVNCRRSNFSLKSLLK